MTDVDAAESEPRRDEMERTELMVSVLDTFTFRAGDRALALPSGSRKLLAFLALRDRPATRQLVASTLWPEAPPQDAASSLRSALWRLKPTASAAVIVEDLDLGPHPDVRVDIRESRALAHRLLDPSSEILPSDETAAAVASLSVDLLPGWYDDWVVDRERGVAPAPIARARSDGRAPDAEGPVGRSRHRRARRDPGRAAARERARRADQGVPRRGQPDGSARGLQPLPRDAEVRARHRTDRAADRPREQSRAAALRPEEPANSRRPSRIVRRIVSAHPVATLRAWLVPGPRARRSPSPCSGAPGGVGGRAVGSRRDSTQRWCTWPTATRSSSTSRVAPRRCASSEPTPRRPSIPANPCSVSARRRARTRRRGWRPAPGCRSRPTPRSATSTAVCSRTCTSAASATTTSCCGSASRAC